MKYVIFGIVAVLAALLVITYLRTRTENTDNEVGGRKVEALFSEFHPILEKRRLPLAKVTFVPDDEAGLTQSKSLGPFYLPRGVDPPKDPQGRPMVLLAQINFSEVPEIPGYPRKGILQFFISAFDDLYGLNLDSFEAHTKQTGFNIRYYPDPKADEAELVSDFSFLPSHENPEVFLPVTRECRLDFERMTETVALGDYRFEEILGDDFFEQFGSRSEEVRNYFWDQLVSAATHKIGGYAYFTQDDPRRWAPKNEDWLLLLQIGSDGDAGIMWGDVGVGNFFIRKSDLERGDFSQVFYNWDCS